MKINQVFPNNSTTQLAIIVDEKSKLARFSEDAVALRDLTLEKSAPLRDVKTPSQNDFAAECLGEIEPLIRATEKARKQVKEPFLEACRQIDASAESFVAKLKAEQLRLRTATGNFAQEQLEIVRQAERDRQAELDRIEREKQAELKRIAEAAAAEERKLAEAAAAEQRKRDEENRRLQAEAAAAKNKKERERIAAEQAELAKKRAIEDAARARQSAIDNAARAEEAKRQSELAAQAAEAVGPQKEIVKADNQSVKEEWDYEVTDIWTLARLYPGFVKIEPRRAEILSVLAMGTRDIKGLKVFSKITQRFGKGTAIDV